MSVDLCIYCKNACFVGSSTVIPEICDTHSDLSVTKVVLLAPEPTKLLMLK